MPWLQIYPFFWRHFLSMAVIKSTVHQYAFYKGRAISQINIPTRDMEFLSDSVPIVCFVLVQACVDEHRSALLHGLRERST